MAQSERSIRVNRQWSKPLVLVACLSVCAMIGSLSFAVNQPSKRSEGSPGSYATTGGNQGTSLSVMQLDEQDIDSAIRISDLPDSSIASSTTKSSKRESVPSKSSQLELIEFKDIPLAQAMRVFSDQSGMNVITSTDAGKARITVFLKNVTLLDALEAIVKANGLFYRIEPSSGIVRIAPLKEYEKDLSSFREEQTKVFTLLYPNPSAVALVFQHVFGDRVQLNRADGEVDDLVDLSQRFNRFDLVDGRSLGLGNHPNRTNTQSGQFARNLGGPFQAGGLGMLGGLGVNGVLQNPNFQAGSRNSANDSRDSDTPRVLSSDQVQQIENAIAQDGQVSDQAQSDLLQRREATIYVSTIRRNNQVIVRTGDAKSMEQITALVAQLDVPTPTVLLEVKVLRVLLADGFNSAFEFLGSPSKTATAFSDGSLTPPFPGASAIAQRLGDGLGVAGSVPGALTFQVVDNNFRVRMQLLESKNCVNALATPLLLTANNEVSRIFVGDTLPFTVGFTPSQVLSTVGAVNGAVAATPITEMRDVGQSLLITPNINADRTVTLRVVEENSERVVGGSSIPVPATSGSGVTNISVDTVRRRTISGTVVAQDGMAVALGGMIEEHDSNARDQVPVLGNIPGIGFFFRRQAIKQVRSELVVIIRPYVFNTPTESAATSETLLSELTNPSSAACATGHGLCALPCAVTRTDAECRQRAKLFQFHSVSNANTQ
ncbi:MAG TPA: hypothetical protein DCF63_20930 [Planctomycetaceae bacterium]|nr:hypothetical protein [Planctomycetaceae bacterium]